MLSLTSIKETIKKIPIGSLSLLILAGSIVFLAISLSAFTLELSLFRRELPHVLKTIDRQITDVQKMMRLAETTGKDFQTGVNKGVSQGIVEVPLGTVANVGYKLSDTASYTGKQTVGFWNVIKDKLMFWQPKKSPTAEAKPKK